MTRFQSIILSYRRFGRRVFWPRPFWYRPIGIARKRGDCCGRDFDLWMDGFPRSANTFCLHAFKIANPATVVRSHVHLPPFIIQALAYKKPGIFLLRKPIDAAISWAIFTGVDLGACLEYYLDFHEAVRSCISMLFIAPFEIVTSDFGKIVEVFNDRFGTDYSSVETTNSMVRVCFERIESAWTVPGSAPNEKTIPRPSLSRANVKARLTEHLHSSPSLLAKLDRANELYSEFREGAQRVHGFRSFSIPQVPILR